MCVIRRFVRPISIRSSRSLFTSTSLGTKEVDLFADALDWAEKAVSEQHIAKINKFPDNPFSEHNIAKIKTFPNTGQLKRLFHQQILRLTDTLNAIDSQRVKENKQILQLRRPFIEKLQRKICSKSSRLILVGSLANGLAIDNKSDLDLAFISTNKEFIRNFWSENKIRIKFMKSIAEYLESLDRNENDPDLKLERRPECLWFTHVPIILCNFQNGVRLDIQFPRGNYQALRNTQMIRRYVATDSRFAQIVNWLKKVFTEMGVINSRQGLFSSYQILTLVLHFLNRSDGDNILPVISPFTLSDSMEYVIKQLEKPARPFRKSRCQKSTGELIIELVDYWARFNPYTTLVCIKSGRTSPKRSDTRQEKLLIFEPFNNLTICRSPVLPQVLFTSFAFLHDRLSNGKYIDNFPQLDGLADDFRAYTRSMKVEWVNNLRKPEDKIS